MTTQTMNASVFRQNLRQIPQVPRLSRIKVEINALSFSIV